MQWMVDGISKIQRDWLDGFATTSLPPPSSSLNQLMLVYIVLEGIVELIERNFFWF